jgi:hypothetical protein
MDMIGHHYPLHGFGVGIMKGNLVDGLFQRHTNGRQYHLIVLDYTEIGYAMVGADSDKEITDRIIEPLRTGRFPEMIFVGLGFHAVVFLVMNLLKSFVRQDKRNICSSGKRIIFL